MEDLEPVFKNNIKTINDVDRVLKADEIINGRVRLMRQRLAAEKVRKRICSMKLSRCHEGNRT